jgi:hypothetical protein
LFNRKIRTKLPELSEVSKPETESVRDRDAEKKEIGKAYSDARRHAVESSISVGDEVLLKQKHQNKFSTTFEPTPYEVVEKHGNQVVIQSPCKTRIFRRNITHTRPYLREEKAVPVEKTPAKPPEEAPVPVADEAQASPSSEVLCPRRSTRSHKPPEHLKDYVCG